MSYIDCFKHEYIGRLNGLPIYHPLDTIYGDGWGAYDFSCSPRNLVLGGGAGEHPALVIHHLDALVAQYILFDIGQKEIEWSDRGYIPPSEEIMNRLWDIAGVNNILEFCSWSMQNTYNFVELAKSKVHNTPLEDKQSVEEWITLSLGELIYFSLSDLNPLHEELQSLLHNEWEVCHWMGNVSCPPPNFHTTKKKSLAQSGFQLRGFFRWDYKFPPEE